MLGLSPPPYQSIGVGMLKDSSLMGVFSSTPPNTDTAKVNMIASFDYDPKGKQIVGSTSLSLHEEMYNIIEALFDDHTDELHLKTYPTAIPVRKKLRKVHPWKDATIKAEIDKLLKSGFIYPIPLTEWISNVVAVNKKQGTNRVSIDFRDLNKVCPKDNFPTLHIDHIIRKCHLLIH